MFNLITLFFSGTGNCLYVAKEIGGKVLNISELLWSDEYNIEDDVVGFVFPCYYYGVPRIVERFMNAMQVKADYIFVVVTYGTTDAGTLGDCERILKKRGLEIDYFNDICMVDNYLPVFDMDKEIKKKDDAEIQRKIDEIVFDIYSKKVYKPKISIIDKVLTKVCSAKRHKSVVDDVDKRFTVDDNCTVCRLCETVCPVRNIRLTDSEDKTFRFNHRCEFCMACINVCPRSAIHVKSEKSSKRYINPHIKVKELKVD